MTDQSRGESPWSELGDIQSVGARSGSTRLLPPRLLQGWGDMVTVYLVVQQRSGAATPVCVSLRTAHHVTCWGCQGIGVTARQRHASLVNPVSPTVGHQRVGGGPAAVLPGRAVGVPPLSFDQRTTRGGHADEAGDLVCRRTSIPIFPAAALGPL